MEAAGRGLETLGFGEKERDHTSKEKTSYCEKPLVPWRGRNESSLL